MSSPTSITIRFGEGPLCSAPSDPAAAGAGARVSFQGVVRPHEDGNRLDALRYSAYQPMASMQMNALAEQVLRDYGLRTLHVEHSTGEVPVGACSFRLVIEADHRKQALDALALFIDTMKQDVPIWKVPVYADSPREPLPRP